MIAGYRLNLEKMPCSKSRCRFKFMKNKRMVSSSLHYYVAKREPKREKQGSLNRTSSNIFHQTTCSRYCPNEEFIQQSSSQPRNQKGARTEAAESRHALGKEHHFRPQRPTGLRAVRSTSDLDWNGCGEERERMGGWTDGNGRTDFGGD